MQELLTQQTPFVPVAPPERLIIPTDPALDSFWRTNVADRCGADKFDEPGSGYSFSAVLAEERELAKGNQAGDPTSALLTLSIADPTHKMVYDAFAAGIELFQKWDDASRYTDLVGIRKDNGTSLGDTHQVICRYLINRFPELTNQITADWIQYSPGAIKRALAEYVPAAFFTGTDTTMTGRRRTQLLFPTPGYGVIRDDINNRGADVTSIPLRFDTGARRWRLPFVGDFQKPDRQPILYLNVPHNPTGMTFDKHAWLEVLNWAETANAIVVVDEAFIDLF